MKRLDRKMLDKIQRILKLAWDQVGTPEGDLAAEMAKRLMDRSGMTRADLLAQEPLGIPASLPEEQRWKHAVADIICWSMDIGARDCDGEICACGPAPLLPDAVHTIRFFVDLIDSGADDFMASCRRAESSVILGRVTPHTLRLAMLRTPRSSFVETAKVALMNRYLLSEADPGEEQDASLTGEDIEAVKAQMREAFMEEIRSRLPGSEEGEAEEDFDAAPASGNESFVPEARDLIWSAEVPSRALAVLTDDLKQEALEVRDEVGV